MNGEHGERLHPVRRWIMRILGGANLLFVALGVYYATAIMWHRWPRWAPQLSPLDWTIYGVNLAASLVFLAFLAYSGIALLRGRTGTLRPLAWVFLCEILLLIECGVEWAYLPSELGNRAASFWEAGRDPLTPQYLAFYPLAGVITAFLLILIAANRSASSAVI